MTAPAEIRSATGEIKTAIPGVTFGSTFPKLAARADRLCVVRSFVPGDANHDIKTIVGKDSHMANIGSAYASAAGSSLPSNGMPTNCVLLPARGRSERRTGTGWLRQVHFDRPVPREHRSVSAGRQRFAEKKT